MVCAQIKKLQPVAKRSENTAVGSHWQKAMPQQPCLDQAMDMVVGCQDLAMDTQIGNMGMVVDQAMGTQIGNMGMVAACQEQAKVMVACQEQAKVLVFGGKVQNQGDKA